VPWSRTSSWSWNLARVTALAAPARPGNPGGRLHSSNGPPPRSPLRPAGWFGGWRGRFPRAGRAAGAGGAGLQRRRAVMVAARPWVTSTMV